MPLIVDARVEPLDETPASDADGLDEPELKGPERLCALTREVKPIGDLIRFGAGLDGVVVPDLALRLPGRGVWIDCRRTAIEEAVRRKVFAKAMKRQVSASADLGSRIEVLFEKRVLESLALANKAGLIVPGFAKVEAAIEGGDVAGLLHGSDGASDGKEKLDRKYAAVQKARGLEIEIIELLTVEQISLAIGRSNVVHAAIISGGAAARLLAEAKRFKRFKASPDAL